MNTSTSTLSEAKPEATGEWHHVWRGMTHARRRVPKQYMGWLAQIDHAPAERLNLNAKNFRMELRDEIENKELYFEQDLVTTGEHPLRLLPHFFDFVKRRMSVQKVVIYVRGPEPFIFANCNIGYLEIWATRSAVITMNQCWIGDLQFRELSHLPKLSYLLSIKMIECWVGKLNFFPGTIRSLCIIDGGILSVACPPSYEANPFYGAVDTKSVFIPRNDGMYLGNKYGASPWTNLRHHLLSSGNLAAASLFHTVALAVDRRDRRWYDIQRFIGAVYEYAGDYGTSISKPLAILFVLWVLCGAAYLCGDGAAIVPNVTLDNWRVILEESQVWRAVYLSTSATLNPLSISLGSPVVEPANHLWLIFLSCQRTVSLVLLFLAAIGIRRQFRMSA